MGRSQAPRPSNTWKTAMVRHFALPVQLLILFTAIFVYDTRRSSRMNTPSIPPTSSLYTCRHCIDAADLRRNFLKEASIRFASSVKSATLATMNFTRICERGTKNALSARGMESNTNSEISLPPAWPLLILCSFMNYEALVRPIGLAEMFFFCLSLCRKGISTMTITPVRARNVSLASLSSSTHPSTSRDT